MLYSVTRCYIVLQIATRCYTVLMGTTRCYIQSHKATKIHTLTPLTCELFSQNSSTKIQSSWQRRDALRNENKGKNRYNPQTTCNWHLITNNKINTLCINVPKMAVSLQSGKLSTRDWRADRANLQTAHKAKALRGCQITQPGLALFAGLAWFAEVTFIPALH